MLEEALEAPAAAARQLAAGDAAIAAVAERWRRSAPERVFTVARGSSDHAAQFTAYLLMSRLGATVTLLPPSLVTLEHAPLPRAGSAVLAFSQSGRSPDLIEAAGWFVRGGADTVAFVNDVGSPLAACASTVVNLQAGTEQSVAATKSFIAQLVAGARLAAAWEGNAAFMAALAGLPDALASAARADWSQAVEVLTRAQRLLVIGRGTGLAIAQEAALKLKEVADIHAEAFSGAEVLHGPQALVHDGQPVLIFAPRDRATASTSG
jgi:glucosamine--fructose-6-phosphate aminotransferase (isomerizing)